MLPLYLAYRPLIGPDAEIQDRMVAMWMCSGYDCDESSYYCVCELKLALH
jgi:hypothetical protein